MKEFIEENLLERIYWLIRLRWIAAAGVILTILFVEQVIHIPLYHSPLYGVALTLVFYNIIFLLYLAKIRKKETANLIIIANKVANLQISLDLMSLAALIHFSGGIENPFIFYFIFHMIIASTLLSRRASYLQASFATFLFLFIVNMEYLNLLEHHYLKGFITSHFYTNKTYILGVSFVFISTLYIAVYMATSIADRLREREKNLKQLNELLEEKDNIKSEYVLRVTHDIKEHLSAIQSCIEPVTEGFTGALNEQQMDLLRRADERAQKLMFFVKTLLEITRLKLTKEIQINYFSLKTAIDNAINFVDAKAKDKNSTINCDIDQTINMIKGEAIYIEETIANLLANSVKYTPKGGKINISVKDKGESVLIQITDNGIGIPKDEIPKVFDEFYRASNARGIERIGTGLGLSIAQQVIDRHNGKIWVESDEGKGSTFYIILPK